MSALGLVVEPRDSAADRCRLDVLGSAIRSDPSAEIVAAKQHPIPICAASIVMLKLSAVDERQEAAAGLALSARPPAGRCRKGPALLRFCDADAALGFGGTESTWYVGMAWHAL